MLTFVLLVAGTDYASVLHKITFITGQSKILVKIPILDDIVRQEPDIYFFVHVIFNKDILARSVITIADNDHGKLIAV